MNNNVEFKGLETENICIETPADIDNYAIIVIKPCGSNTLITSPYDKNELSLTCFKTRIFKHIL